MTKLKEEFFKILPPTIFFFVALHLVMFIRVLMLEGTGLSPYSSASIAVTALVLGKAVLLADMLPLINRFLTNRIIWKEPGSRPTLQLPLPSLPSFSVKQCYSRTCCR